MDTQRNSVSPCLLLGEVTINPQQRAVEIEDHDLYCAAPWNDAHVGKSSVPSEKLWYARRCRETKGVKNSELSGPPGPVFSVIG
ncbi:hypothetical protein M513_02820 [Trichuris suis]|uniref:Uncharacterized protein n=1 Tax=Trichuris suis TaxID=68888 RepID=A0A085MGL9_9BILA|nr:hypothetical protein M513_02820 [Trichuris suis]